MYIILTITATDYSFQKYDEAGTTIDSADVFPKATSNLIDAGISTLIQSNPEATMLAAYPTSKLIIKQA